MEGKRLIKSLRLQNLLSYGSKGEAIELEPLNVLIGRNASGKSNLIEVISLLRATPTDISTPIRQGGGIREWLWKGTSESIIGDIEVHLKNPERNEFFQYITQLEALGQKHNIVEEHIRKFSIDPLSKILGDTESRLVYRYENNQAVILPSEQSLSWELPPRNGEQYTKLGYELAKDLPQKSILSLLRDPHQYGVITYIGDKFRTIKIYGTWDINEIRKPQKADLPEDFLSENGNNLGLILNDFQFRRSTKQRVIEELREFYKEVEDYSTKLQSGTVQIFIHEEGLSQPIPATRLSDGTLRYMCLLAVLCHPEPPSLICIEEPELGLHPDILPRVAKLLVEASQRTQLIVTTHSDVLVSALSHVPESILVCERDEDGTHLRRLEPEPLKEWLDKYSLGELWRMGEIGGNV